MLMSLKYQSFAISAHPGEGRSGIKAIAFSYSICHKQIVKTTQFVDDGICELVMHDVA